MVLIRLQPAAHRGQDYFELLVQIYDVQGQMLILVNQGTTQGLYPKSIQNRGNNR